MERDSPEILAALSLGYFLLMLAGMLAFGEEIWATSADGFGAYFGLLSRMSPLTVDENGELYARRPLSALTSMPVRSGTVASGLRGDRNHHLRRLLQRRRVAQARAPPAEHLLGPQLPSDAGDRARVHDRPAAVRRPHQAHLRARHQGGADRQLPLHQGRAEPCLRPHAGPDRVRLRARPLLLAADLAGPGDRSSSPRTRSATAPTSSAPLPTGSTTRSSPSRRSGTSR